MEGLAKDLNFKDFVNWAFMLMLVGVVAFGVRSIETLNQSVAKNNKHVTTLLERTLWHDRELKRHDKQFDSLNKELEVLKTK